MSRASQLADLIGALDDAATIRDDGGLFDGPYGREMRLASALKLSECARNAISEMAGRLGMTPSGALSQARLRYLTTILSATAEVLEAVTDEATRLKVATESAEPLAWADTTWTPSSTRQT